MANILAITNIGILISGDIEKGVLDADTVLIKKDKIQRVGNRSIIPKKVDRIIDANGMAVIPGLIDSHIHPYLGDWTPRLNMHDWMANSVHGGVTTMISQGESHIPGKRPRDKEGTKALAILAKKSYETFRPGGMKVDGGPIIFDTKLNEKDFKDLAQAGVWRVAEIGGGGLYKYKDIKDMLIYARKYGMKISAHCGGVSQRTDSAKMTAKDILRINPDIAVHVNGGPTSLSYKDIERLVKESNFALEIVYNGNPKMMLETIKLSYENDCLHRIIIGSDSPTGRGVMIVAILKMVTMIASIGEIPPEKALTMATGNTADAFGLRIGKIEQGRAADLVLTDAPVGSAAHDAFESFRIGDVPGVAMVLIDGEIVVPRGRFTAPPMRAPKIIERGN